MSKLKGKSPELAIRNKPKVLMYGKSGVGKTWGALDFPNCYYIDTEGGAKEPEYIQKLANAGGVYFGPEDGALDFKEVLGQFQALATEKHNYKTLIVDSITKLFNTAVGFEQERLGDKDQYGASKKLPVSYMRRMVNWTSRIDMNVIFVAHAKDEYGLAANGQREAVGTTYDGWDKLEYELELALHIEKAGPRRTMKVRKSRIAAFEEGRVYEWSYDSFAKLYGRDTIERDVKQVVLASPEQVAEIMRYVDLMKIPQEETERWLTKAGADNFAEFSMEQAAKTLAFLNARLEGRAA